jgi:hypothetical protein
VAVGRLPGRSRARDAAGDPARSWAEVESALWGALPAPLRAYLDPGPGRTGTFLRAHAAALLAARRFHNTIREKLTTAEGVRYEELSPEARQQFLDWLAYNNLAQAFGWFAEHVPPWLIHPERCFIETSRGPFIEATTPEAAAALRKAIANSPNADEPMLRVIGPGVKARRSVRSSRSATTWHSRVDTDAWLCSFVAAPDAEVQRVSARADMP